MNLTLSLLLLLTIGLATAGIFHFKPTSKPSNQPVNNLNSAAEQPTFENGPVRMIRFVLLRDGLYPSQMRVDQGLLNIALEDKTGGSEGLIIESALGDQRTKVSEIRRVEKHWRGRAQSQYDKGTPPQLAASSRRSGALRGSPERLQAFLKRAESVEPNSPRVREVMARLEALKNKKAAGS